MPTRTQHSPQERQARSQAVQRLARQPLLRGSIVVMNRSCGKKTCHCQRGRSTAASILRSTPAADRSWSTSRGRWKRASARRSRRPAK